MPFALELGRPGLAALVLAVAAAALVASRRRPSWRHSPRFLLVLAVALVAGDLRARDPDPPRLRVFVVDRSRSFEGGRAPIQAALDLGARDLDVARDRVAVIAFGATPLVVLEPSPPSQIREGARLALAASIDGTTTDLGAALDLALDVARSEPASGEVVLLTDGRDTAGRARPAAARLAARGIAVHAVAPPASTLVNARIVRIEAPSRVALHETARVTVAVEATVRGRLRTHIACDGAALVGDGSSVDSAEPDVTLRRTFLVKPSRAGVVTVTATVELLDAEDGHREDDADEAAMLVGDRARALLVGESPAWRLVLDSASFEVDAVAPEALHGTLARGLPPSLVVLHEIDAAKVPVRALADHIASGGGLVVAGDRHAFGPGHYSEHPDLEALLPVRSGPPDSRQKPLALELVIDCSGSMEQRFIPAVRAILPRGSELHGSDSVKVVVFNESQRSGSTDPDVLEKERPGGSTNIGAAVVFGLDELATRDGRRLLVLVTDAEDTKLPSYHAAIRAKIDELGPDFEAAFVLIGSENADPLKNLVAAVGKHARYFHVAEAGRGELERLVKGDLVNGSKGERRQGTFKATLGGFLVTSYAPVRPKDLPRAVLTVHDPERELPAALAVANDHVLAIATDLDSGGAAFAGEGRTLLLDLVRSVARRDTSDLALEAERTPGWIRIIARTRRTGLTATTRTDRALFQPVAPGELEARLRAPREAALVSILEGDIPLAGVTVQAESSLELAPPRRDLELLTDLVAPGGSVLPDLGELPRPRRPKETQRALAGPLALAALAFLVLEGGLAVALERLAARRAARRTFETAR